MLKPDQVAESLVPGNTNSSSLHAVCRGSHWILGMIKPSVLLKQCVRTYMCAHVHTCTFFYFFQAQEKESGFLCQAKGKQQASASGTVASPHRILSINDTLKRFLAQPLPDLDHPGEPGQKYTLLGSTSAGGQPSAESSQLSAESLFKTALT